MPAQSSRQARQRHQNPLEKDILASAPLRTTPKKRKAQRRDDEEGEDYVDSRASRKILRIGQELEEEEERDSAAASISKDAFAFESRPAKNEDHEGEAGYDDDEGWGDEQEVTEEVEIDPNDLDLFNRFNPNGEEPTFELNAAPPARVEQGTNLADLILQRIEEHQAKESGQPVVVGGGLPEDAIEIPLKVVEVYAKVGTILSRCKSLFLDIEETTNERYKTNPASYLSLSRFETLPTISFLAFLMFAGSTYVTAMGVSKVLMYPLLFNILNTSRDLLAITKPESWTPNACFEATKIFISGPKKTARTFIEMVLLERVREEIRETRKVSVHLFKAMRKATFKAEAFFKGLLFPLVESGCTLREAQVITGVLTRASIVRTSKTLLPPDIYR